MRAASYPGKTTLTQGLSTSWRSMPPPSVSRPATQPSWAVEAGEAGAAARRPSATRIADATEGKTKPNAVLKVIVIDDGRVIQRWQSRARWEGPLPQQYTATRAGAAWKWDDAGGKSIKVQTNERGGGGKSIEVWASASADRIVVHAQALDDVTIDSDVEPDARAPGHARDQEDAGDGSTTRINPRGEGSGTGDAEQQRGRDSRAGGDRGRSPRRDHGGEGATALEPDQDLGPSAADEKLADDFERELGLDLDDDDADRDGGEARGGEGEAGGEQTGRTGDDTRRGGTGPGGKEAKSDGKGKGSEDDRGTVGSEGGSREGQRGGDEEGMYGGEGKHGDRGVPSAIALFGGLLSVPAALRASSSWR